MGFLARSLLVTSGILAAMLLWWRPPTALLSVRPLDWAVLYERQHTPTRHLWGAMEMAREMIRANAPHLPLTEFIEETTRGRIVRGDNDRWRRWYGRHFASSHPPDGESLYFSPAEAPLADLAGEQGYVAVKTDGHIHFLDYRRIDAADLAGKVIPAELRYPQRRQALMVLVAALAFWGITRFRAKAANPMAVSTTAMGCRATGAIFAAGVALMALPFVYHYPEEGAPFFFIGSFVFLCGAIGLALFGWQMRTLGRILGGKDQLACWTYDPEEWKRFVAWEFTEETSEKRGLLMLVSAIILVVGGGFWLVIRDAAAAWVFVFLIGLAALLWAVAWIVPRLTRRRNLKALGEVYIGRSGIYMNGAVHTWNLPGSRFESAAFIEKPFPLLVFVYSYLMVAGRALYVFRQAATVRVPVPRGREVEAAELAGKFPEGGLQA